MFGDVNIDSDEEQQTEKTAKLLSLFTKIPSRKRKSELASDTSSFHSDLDNTSTLKHHNDPGVTAKPELPSFNVIVPKYTDDVFAIDSDSSIPRKKHQSYQSWNLSHEKQQSVTHPSPDSQFLGLSTIYYPVDEAETKASEKAYPKQKSVDPKLTPLSLTNLPEGLFRKKYNQVSSRNEVLELLKSKLSKIRGPRVTLSLGSRDDATSFPLNFEFVNSYKIRSGVEKADESFDAGCNCGIVCDTKTCTCLSQEIDSDDRINPYEILRDGTYVLNKSFLNRTAMIYECTSLCGCTHHCWNRVVERGRTIRFDIFDTGSRGFGLRSPDQIRAGQFIDLYLGEVITKASANRRETLAEEKKSPSYLFSLDFLINDNKIYVVDGQKYGSPTRFMNHSCNPNCKMFPVSRHHGDERLYDLAFFALRDIPPMTELTFDYNPGWDGYKKKKRKNQVDPNAVQCLCGEPNCRGQLWPTRRKRTKRD